MSSLWVPVDGSRIGGQLSRAHGQRPCAPPTIRAPT